MEAANSSIHTFFLRSIAGSISWISESGTANIASCHRQSAKILDALPRQRWRKITSQRISRLRTKMHPHSRHRTVDRACFSSGMRR